jgi:hypothetical protein
MLVVQQTEDFRRASLISEIYSENAFTNVAKRDDKRFSAIAAADEDGKKGRKERKERKKAAARKKHVHVSMYMYKTICTCTCL